MLNFQATQPVRIEDRALRISWAKEDFGDLLGGGGGGGGGGFRGGYGGVVDPHTVHPRVSQARLAAAQVAEQIGQHELAEYNLDGPPPERQLVSYDDL